MGCSRVKRLHSSEDIPCECRTGYIQTGYRPVPCSLEDCIKSAFQLNNETVNFWTHFIPFILMVRRSYGIVSSFEDPFDPINFAYYVHSIATIYVFIVSSAAHLFSTHSVSYNGRCFSVDRAAIVTQGFSMKLVVENLMCPASCYLVQDTSRPTYLFFTVLVAVLVTSLFCAGTLPKLKRFKSQLRSLPFGVAGFLINFPCILRYSFTNQSSDQDCFDLAKGHHTLFYLQASASLLAGVFYALRIPERFYPGRFDIFGSSHQIFHVLIAIGLYFQNKLIEEVTEEAKYKINAGEISHEILGTHWMYTIGLFVLVTGVVHSIVVLFYWKIDPCCKTAGNAEKQE